LFRDRARRSEDSRPDRVADDYSETKANPEHAQQMALMFHIRVLIRIIRG
jgi:hypothetical protein